MALPGFGPEGQQRLRDSSVLVIGAGGLGSPALLYLAAAGVGRIGIVDGDEVEISNLHRQVLHAAGDVGRAKVDSARERLQAIDPAISIETHVQQIVADNSRSLIRGWDLVIDGSDNFPTRYVVNDAAFFEGVPVVYGSVFRFEGQVSLFSPPQGPCYRCIYPSPPPAELVPNCEEGGVLGVVPGVVGVLQASEAIRYLTGIGRSLEGRLLLVDLLSASFREMKIPRNRGCALCGESPTIHEVRSTSWSCETGAEVSLNEDITPKELSERLADGERPRLIDVREQWEWDLGHIEGAEHIPLAKLPSQLDQLNPQEEVVVYCRSGGRSGRAVAHMREQGFANARNMLGGILRWSSDVDPSIPRY